MKPLLLTFGLALALAMAAPAFAQEPPPSNESAFDALSTGNQKIVDAIYDSQLGSFNDQMNGTLLTTDAIAALKADTGWGNVYKTLYDQGFVSHKNLGQAISSHILDNKFGTTTTVVTTGSGEQITTGDRKGKGADASSFKGGNTGSQSSGNKFGHFENSGITTGAGGSSFGASGGSFGGGGSKGRGRASRGRR